MWLFDRLFSFKNDNPTININIGRVEHSNITCAGRDVNIINTEEFQHIQSLMDSGQIVALKQFVLEKADNCQKALCEKDLKDALSIISLIKNTDYPGCDNTLKVRFKLYELVYKIMLEKDNDDNSNILWQLLSDSSCKEQIIFLKKICFDSGTVFFDDFINQCPVLQACGLDVLFRKKQYQNIISWYQLAKRRIDKKDQNKHDGSVSNFLTYYAAHSAFNLRNYQFALSLYKELEKNESYCNRIRRFEIKGMCRATETILASRLLDNQGKVKLQQSKSALQYILINSQEKELVSNVQSVLLWQILLWACIMSDDDSFLSTYEKIPKELQKNKTIMITKGIFFESKFQWNKAESFYLGMDWENSEDIFVRLMTCYFYQRKYEQIISYVESVGAKSGFSLISMKLLRLGALAQTRPDIFVSEFEHEWKNSDLDNNSRAKFSLCLNSCMGEKHKKLFTNYVIPWLIQMQKEQLVIDFETGLGLVFMLISFGKYKSASSIMDDNFMEELKYCVPSIHFSFLEIVHPFSVNKNGDIGQIIDRTELEGRIAIADRFILHDILVCDFLKLKMYCLFHLKRTDDSLICAKDCFTKFHDSDAASMMISLSQDGSLLQKDELKKCIENLEKSIYPIDVIVAAIASESLGDSNHADLLFYKALYMDNGANSESFIRACVSFYMKTIGRHKEKIQFSSVRDGCAIKLIEITPDKTDTNNSDFSPIVRWLCIDCERDFIGNETSKKNLSLGMKHVTPDSLIYEKIIDKKVGNTVKLDSVFYTISEIVSRDFKAREYVMKFLFDKAQTSNFYKDGFQVYQLKVDPNNPEQMAKSLSKFVYDLGSSSRETYERMHSMYSNKNNPWGIPIELLSVNGYGNYINVIKMLLFCKDEELNVYRSVGIKEKTPFIISLSSLFVMGVLDLLWILHEIPTDIKIPSSVKNFVAYLAKSQRKLQDESEFNFVAINENDFFLDKRDPKILEILQDIYEYCCGIEEVDVSIKDRKIFFEKNTTLGFCDNSLVNACQFDPIIAAQKLNGSVIYDDRFFGRISDNLCGVCSLTTESLIDKLDNKDNSIKAKKKLSKTGYKVHYDQFRFLW